MVLLKLIYLNQSSSIVSIAVPRNVQCSTDPSMVTVDPVLYLLPELYLLESSKKHGKSTDKIKLVLCPVVDSTPALNDVL